LEAEWLHEDLLEKILVDLLNFVDKAVENFGSLASTLGLVITDGFSGLMVARIKDSLQSTDDVVLAIVGRKDWLQVGIVYVVHEIVTMRNGFVNKALDLQPLLLFGLF
jgi:hypothetical protein